LGAPTTTLTPPIMDYELRGHWTDRGHINLVLALLAFQENLALADLTEQRALDDQRLVHAAGHRTTHRSTVLRTRFPARRLRVGLGLALRKRGGLALTLAVKLFKSLLQKSDPLLLLGDSPQKLIPFPKEFLVSRHVSREFTPSRMTRQEGLSSLSKDRTPGKGRRRGDGKQILFVLLLRMFSLLGCSLKRGLFLKV
jgi:hypothetical protein